jgi:hypothetical protein
VKSISKNKIAVVPAQGAAENSDSALSACETSQACKLGCALQVGTQCHLNGKMSMDFRFRGNDGIRL